MPRALALQLMSFPVLAALTVGCAPTRGCPECSPPECPPPAAAPAPECPTEPDAAPAAVDVAAAVEKELGPPPVADADEHRFARLAYPAIEGAFGPGTRLEFDLFGTSLRSVAFGVTEDVLEGLEVRMHLVDGRVVEPGEDPFPNMLGGHAHGGPRTAWIRTAPFEWQGNSLDEAWVSVDLGPRGRYWLEMPYGLIRDPDGPLPDDDTRERPGYAPAMKELGARDRIVPFRHVEYEVGELQRGWQLVARVSNPFDPHVELELYRDDGGVGQSAYRWAMDEPTTSATFITRGGARLPSMRMLTRLHEDGLRRSDHFKFNRRPGGRRSWGALELRVGEETRTIRVPSSLYLYTHGTADPYDERRTVNAAAVLGRWLF